MRPRIRIAPANLLLQQTRGSRTSWSRLVITWHLHLSSVRLNESVHLACQKFDQATGRVSLYLHASPNCLTVR
jgi:hypothetical protein